MSLSEQVAINARRAALLGADIPRVDVSKVLMENANELARLMATSRKTEAVKKPIMSPSIPCSARVAGQVATPKTGFPTAEVMADVAEAITENFTKMELLSTSDDGVVQIYKRSTHDEAYGLVGGLAVNGVPRTTFAHYPVHFLAEEELTKFIHDWSSRETSETHFAGLQIKGIRLQLEGLCIKVFTDASGALRFATKKKAQLSKELENIFLETLVQNHAEMRGIKDLELARMTLMATLQFYTVMDLTLTFRLVHPAVTYVRGPLDLSKNKPKAVLVQWGDKHIDSQADLTLPGVFTTLADVYGACKMDSFGAVMVELFNPESGLTYYAKLVSQRRHQQLLEVAGINGNFRAFVAQKADKCKTPSEFEGAMTKLSFALDPYHHPALLKARAEIGQGLNDGTEVVAKFLERNLKELRNEKSELVKALFKMDCKLAEKLVSAAGMFNPKRGKALDFVKGMRLAILEGHIKLLTQVVQKKLTHTNPGVAEAARLCADAM